MPEGEKIGELLGIGEGIFKFSHEISITFHAKLPALDWF